MTENEIPYGEAWLMETALENFVGLWMFRLTEESLAQNLNQPSHGMNRKELARTLVRMFHRGELILEGYDDPEGVVYTADDILKILLPRTPEEKARANDRRGLAYGLSPLGASRWERWAQPDWQRFYSGQYVDQEVDETGETETGRGTSEFLVADEQRLDELLRHAGELWEYDVIHGVERELLEPFAATYWKTLPRGYRIRLHWQTLMDRVRSSTRETRRANRLVLRWHRTVMEWPDDWRGFDSPSAR